MIGFALYVNKDNFLTRAFILGLLLFLLSPFPVMATSDRKQQINNLLGPRDALLLTDQSNNILFEHQPEKNLVPASTLKVLTALTAFYYLGSDYRFRTDFYQDKAGNLKVKGHGDPLLISEAIEELAVALAARLKRCWDIILDDSFL